MSEETTTRRNFLGVAGAGLVVAGLGLPVIAQEKGEEKQQKEEEEVSPGEDLMREHGVLKRVLLVYGEAVRRIDANEALPPDAVLDAAKLIRSMIEDYHEKLEEEFLFPRFRKANTLVELVEVLKQQHDAGRKVTDVTLRYANAQALRDAGERGQLRESLAEFIRMYNPHEAREDTVLFPAFKKLIPEKEYDSLGEEFERREKQQLGENGFEKAVDRVAAMEKALGIYDLAQFTPKVQGM